MIVQTKKKVPDLRFPEFDGEWEEKRLGNVFKFIRTNSYSRNQLNYEKGEVKNIHYGDIHTKFKTCFDSSQEDVPFINEDVDLSRITEDDFCRVGDVIFADASEDYKDIGKAIEIVKVDTNKLVSGLHTILARDYKNLLALGFKGFLFQSRRVRLQIMTFSAGAKVLGISKTNLAEINICSPPLPEQQKIADFLTAIDIRIQQFTQKLDLLQDYKKGVMQQIFSQQIRFTDDQGKDYTAWEEGKLKDVFQIRYGKDYKHLESGKIPVIGTGGVMTLVNYYLYNKPSVLIGRKGTIDKPRYIDIPFWTVDTCFYTEINKGFDPFFVYLLVSNINWLKYNEATGVPSLNTKGIYSVKVKTPSLPEQQRIADFLGAIDQKIDLTRQQRDQMQEYKKGLLQQMFV